MPNTVNANADRNPADLIEAYGNIDEPKAHKANPKSDTYDARMRASGDVTCKKCGDPIYNDPATGKWSHNGGRYIPA